MPSTDLSQLLTGETERIEWLGRAPAWGDPHRMKRSEEAAVTVLRAAAAVRS